MCFSPLQVLLHSTPEVQRQYLARLVMATIPWTNSHTHSVRTFAQLVTMCLVQRFPLDHPLWEQSTVHANAATAAENSSGGGGDQSCAGAASGDGAMTTLAAAGGGAPSDVWLDAPIAGTPNDDSEASGSKGDASSTAASVSGSNAAAAASSAGDSAAASATCTQQASPPPQAYNSCYPSLRPGTGDYQYLRHVLRYYNMNADIQRLRRAMGQAILDWTPEGVTSPRRIFASGTGILQSLH